MTDERQQIKQILFDNDKNKKWLKNRVPHIDIYYLLSDNCKRFDVKDYNEIMNIFKNEGFITNEAERCNQLIDTVLKINSLLGNGLDLLNSSVSSFTIDKELTFPERHRLALLFDDLELSLVKRIDESKKILGLK